MNSIAELATSFVGYVLEPGATGFDEARKIHNGLIDRKPALIARCRGLADIVDAMRYAREAGLEISVRGGGHNVGGRAVVDDGIMIDLSLMKGIHTNASRRTAVVEGGVLWKEFNREAQLHGLATTGGVIGTTGVAGLTLGGGLGWLMTKYGMALDNLISVNMVLADGSVATASAEENSDLFWAVRGGGGNFGIAASFEFQLHQVGPLVFGGLAAFPFSEARQVLRGFRDLAGAASDDLMVVAGLTTTPDGSGTKIAAVVVCHTGASADAEETAARIRGFGTVAMDALGPIAYTALNGMLDSGFPSGALNYWKSTFLPKLSDEAIEAMVSAYERCPVPTSSIMLESFHGQATRVPVDATAFALRDKGFNTLVLGQWMNQTDSEGTTSWCRASFNSLHTFAGERRYANYLGSDEEAGAAAVAAYGPNLAKLRQLKSRYDPENVFHQNLNILPG
jgi:FAD/FMN-containing dehydrogenase